MISYRSVREDELYLLDDFLYLAIHQEDLTNSISRSVLEVPEVAAYVEGVASEPSTEDAAFTAVPAILADADPAELP
ncbi:MAG: hypothetical protein ACK5LO_12675 [Leucobacter sp.]